MDFLSEEWFETMKERTAENLSRPGKVSVTYCEVYTDCPGEHDTVWIDATVRDSVLQDMTMGYGADTIPQADYVCTGTCRDHAAVTRGEINDKAALLSGKFKLQGNMVRALKLIGIYNAFTEGKKVPGTTY